MLPNPHLAFAFPIPHGGMSGREKTTIPVLQNDYLDTKLKKKDLIHFISENQ